MPSLCQNYVYLLAVPIECLASTFISQVVLPNVCGLQPHSHTSCNKISDCQIIHNILNSDYKLYTQEQHKNNIFIMPFLLPAQHISSGRCQVPPQLCPSLTVTCLHMMFTYDSCLRTSPTVMLDTPEGG